MNLSTVPTPMVEILPVQQDAQGMTYRAVVYTSGNDRIELQARVSEAVRRRLAAAAARSLAWLKGHVRLPHGPLQDLMAGAAPDCGCDTVGEAFRAASLACSDAAEGWYQQGYELPAQGTLLTWNFDDWQGMEDQLLPDLRALAWDSFGAPVAMARGTMSRTSSPTAAALLSRMQPTLTAGPRVQPGGRVVAQAQPGMAVLAQAFRAVLGH